MVVVKFINITESYRAVVVGLKVIKYVVHNVVSQKWSVLLPGKGRYTVCSTTDELKHVKST